MAIDTNNSGLQSTLQAQVQADTLQNQRDARARTFTQRDGGTLEPAERQAQAARNAAVQGEQNANRVGQDQANRQQSQSSQLATRDTQRVGGLSSRAEIEEAGARIEQAFNPVGQREAPVGRTSDNEAQRRNVPLGQIVDIRV